MRRKSLTLTAGRSPEQNDPVVPVQLGDVGSALVGGARLGPGLEPGLSVLLFLLFHDAELPSAELLPR